MLFRSSLKADLLLETEMLVRSWEQHEAAWLRDYLVAGVEDPRFNLQSIVSRHFLINELAPGRFTGLMRQEYRFAAAMEWLLRGSGLLKDAEARHATLHALRRGSDNAEGEEIPGFIVQTFANLPVETDDCVIPNYLEAFLTRPTQGGDPAGTSETTLDTFGLAWQAVLQKHFPSPRAEPHLEGDTASDRESAVLSENTSYTSPTLLEPACGSANDYRFFHRYGLARLFHYTGFDLSQKNIENARRLFPTTNFQAGNVFEIAAPSKSFDFCMVHDLFEHLSLAGLEQAVSEICRVTRRGLCLGFFQMDEIPEHVVRPREQYYWNLLSLTRVKGLLASHGFTAQAIHMGSFLARHTGCQYTHNPNAYVFIIRSKPAEG